MAQDASTPILLSVVSPAHNEEDNLATLVAEITSALDPLEIAYEILLIDDGSTDSTNTVIRTLLPKYPRLRAIRMTSTPPGKGNGQSAAFHAGFRAAQGEVIAVLDADLQNDPADIPAMLALLQSSNADMIQGDRSHARKDNIRRRFSSWVGRMFRKMLLSDTIRDTGCSLRIMRRNVALAIPLEFRGMHRFIPLTARKLGFNVIEARVNHRPRVAGVPKYGMLDRAFVGLHDCFAVRWMSSRRRPTTFCAITNDHSSTCQKIPATSATAQSQAQHMVEVAPSAASRNAASRDRATISKSTSAAQHNGAHNHQDHESSARIAEPKFDDLTAADLIAAELKPVEPRHSARPL
ncbi:MAG TPA: glycosyltransferase family 2 protein [Phycisphaerales bacterium]|nr:glycosyltransferase family 2 protein [Phycisphaerales bacterium]